jgi:ABC-type bacteriocin/lantibiotic exporter with double-glycine peptidase domain
MKNATFSWPGEDAFQLKDISIEVPKNKLIFIIGNVGSGKSSLLQAILGEMKYISGTSKVSSSISNSPQIPWIQNESLRQNILFGNEFEQRKYEKIIEDCCLCPDIELLPNGDLSEIGEKGMIH